MDEKDTTMAPNADAMPSALSGAIEGILAHPELISMVASALGKGAPSTEASPMAPPSEPTPTQTVAKEALPDALAALSPLLSGLSGASLGRHDDPRVCLLRALKPYLSAGRCEAIDYMIRLSALSDALRTWNERAPTQTERKL